ncbi:MAG: hypothetical protein ABJL67_12190 [Sulfitobacter sp.]
MKRITLVTCMLAAAAIGAAAQAGSLSDPVVTPQIIIEDTTNSSSGEFLVLGLAYLFVIASLD